MVEGVGFVGRADASSNFSDDVFNALCWWTRRTSCRILQVASSQEMQHRSQELGERCICGKTDLQGHMFKAWFKFL